MIFTSKCRSNNGLAGSKECGMITLYWSFVVLGWRCERNPSGSQTDMIGYHTEFGCHFSIISCTDIIVVPTCTENVSLFVLKVNSTYKSLTMCVHEYRKNIG